MRTTFFGLLAAVTLFAGVSRATESADAAQDHSTLYQREVRTALTERGWRITRDESGVLIAEHKWPNLNGTDSFLLNSDINRYARLQVTFRSDGKNHTASSALASLCYYYVFNPTNVNGTIYPPTALRDPKLTREYRDILAEADSHLAGGQRVHAAEGSGKLAMK